MAKEAWGPVAAGPVRRGYKWTCCAYERFEPADFGAVDPTKQLSSVVPTSGPARIQGAAAAPVTAIGSAPVKVANGFYDAHVHMFDFSSQTDGIGNLLSCMDESGVSHAAITGCPLKKNWSEFEKRMSENVVCDTDVLYYYSVTDHLLINQLKVLPPDQAGRFAPLMSGFKPTDRNAPQQIAVVIDESPEVSWKGLGKLYFRFSEITNLTTGPVPTAGHPAVTQIFMEAGNRGLPVIIQNNACSESTKPYKYGFEYMPELEECLQSNSNVRVLWVDAGMYVRGQWKGYQEALDNLMTENPNLYISITPEALKHAKISHKGLIEIAEKHPDNVVVGSSTMGLFKKGNRYKKDWDAIIEWAGQLSNETYKKVTFRNAQLLYSAQPPSPNAKGKMRVSTFAKSYSTAGSKGATRTKSDKLHDPAKTKKLDEAEVAEKNKFLDGMVDGVLIHDSEIKHVTIDVHLHMLDFLHKSSGTRKILDAMDGCGVEKAILIGMPCCKKWSKDEPEKPLYYQDDNGQCYVYAYSDQMVADAWMALCDDKRKRFAPVMGGINPTDIAAVEHIDRMWTKYPGMWRGLGEIMCRHDDLTMLLQDDEVPVINHKAMNPIYEFSIAKNLNCMVHHNADRTAEEEDDGTHEYLWEVEEVLNQFPDLKLIWAHAGVSRRTHEPNHHEMIDALLTDHPQLHIDMSWVVWEEVVLDPKTTKPSQKWIDLFQKHSQRFSIGSDQVGQFISPAKGNLLKPEIVKYWALGECCSKETAQAILYGNAQRIWFEGWDTPTSDKGPRWGKIPPCMKAETLFHNQGYFDWVDEEMY